ncbi:MAG: hypothetical protein QOI64_1800 [Solirubrobacteraceae bacterium]|nr:hypothetical protein [Solirubrobacteraceae bacterium]
MTTQGEKPVTAQDEQPPGRGGAAALQPKILLELLGASAGVAAFMALLGGTLLWVRFDELGLPADRAITLLPREMLITVGAHALLGPVIAGIIAVVAIWALDDHSEVVLGFSAFCVTVAVLVMLLGTSSTAIGVATVVGLIVGLVVRRLSQNNDEGLIPEGIGLKDNPLIVMLAVLAISLLPIVPSVTELQVIPWAIAVVAVVFVGLGLIFVSMSRNPGRARRPVLWIVFVVYLFTGTTVALVRTGGEPKMEPIAVLLKDPEQQLAGFYVGESSAELHVAQLTRGSGLLGVSAEPVEAVVSVARSRVVRKALRAPAGLGLGDAGREQAETLLENLVAEQRAVSGEQVVAAEPVATAQPERTFAPLVSLHAGETSAPWSAEEFLRTSRLSWALRDCPPAQQAFGALATRQEWSRLGSGDYRQGADCGQGDTYTSKDHTRPFDKGRTFEDGRRALTGREGFYIDLPDNLRTRKLRTQHNGDQLVLKSSPVYYERHAEDANVRLTYWLFYPFSFPTGTNEKIGHEGDWERVSVLVQRTGAGLWVPLSVRFHAHSGEVDVAWADVRKAPDESGRPTHPRAYSAKGSHATYRRGGQYLQVLSTGSHRIIAVKDDARACPQCPLWFTWERLVDAQKQPWYGFGGAWGKVGSAPDFTGPLGPSIRKTVGGKGPSPETALQQTSNLTASVLPEAADAGAAAAPTSTTATTAGP